MKYVIYTILTIVGITILGIGARLILFPVNTVNKMIDTAYDAQSKVINADNAIYNYEWFKQKFQDIEAAERQYKNAVVSYASFQQAMPESRLDWTFEDKTEDARLRAVVDGLYNFKQSLIGDYNARASMATRNIFENSVLPSFIDSLTFITK